MNAKEYLLQLKALKIKIKEMHDLADYYECKMNSIPGGSICMIGNDPSPSHEPNNIKYLCKLDDQNKKIEKAEKDYKKLEDNIISIISSLADDREKEVLLRRYVECEEWNTILSNMYISKAQAFRVHSLALVGIDNILNSQQKDETH